MRAMPFDCRKDSCGKKISRFIRHLDEGEERKRMET